MTTDLPPSSLNAFFVQLREKGDLLPKRLRQCASYIAANPNRIAISTVAELAAAAEVQPSAWIRFCREFGFDGFSQMQKMFRDDYSKMWPDYASRLDIMRERETSDVAGLFAEFSEAGRASLEATMSTAKTETLELAVDQLCQAETIHIMGYRRSFPVASYVSYIFEKMDISSKTYCGMGGLGLAPSLQAQDALLAISFVPYARETLAMVDHAHRRGNNIVAITDKYTSPLARPGILPVFVSEAEVDSFRTLAATLTLATSLAVAVGMKKKSIPK